MTNLDIDIDAIRAEFAEFIAAPLRQPTDIDTDQIAEALGVAKTTARIKIREIAAQRPDYQLLEVKEGKYMRWVLRKIR